MIEIEYEIPQRLRGLGVWSVKMAEHIARNRNIPLTDIERELSGDRLVVRINNVFLPSKIAEGIISDIGGFLSLPFSTHIETRGYPYTLGLEQDPLDERDYEAKNILTVKREELPESISYREEMTPVREQGNLGSCSAFAVVAAKEWMEHLKPERLPPEDLSELDLYRETKERDPWDSQGTSLRYVLKTARELGITDERACPYTDEFPVKRDTEWWGWGKVREWELIQSYHRLRTKDEMKKWLVEHGCFVLGIPVGIEIFDPPNNIVPPPSFIIGGHAICICGYDEEDRLEFKNSWGSEWGDNGYAKLSSDYLDKVDWYDCWGFLPPSK